MNTHCMQKSGTSRGQNWAKQTKRNYEFGQSGKRRVVAAFDGGRITSDGGALLLAEVEQRYGIIKRFSECFSDHRTSERIEHTVRELVAQRVYAIALGYEDLNDHDDLRRDALLATLVGKSDPTGAERKRGQDKGKPLAGKSTLNRLEMGPEDAEDADRYKRIVCHGEKVRRFLVDGFIETRLERPERLVLDIDATDDRIHGMQQGRYFHGYYGDYCYLPLYIFCGDWLLGAKLRTSHVDASTGSVEEIAQIVSQLRDVWPDVEICVRADSGFCREEMMAWCENNDVHYVLGIAKNNRLRKEVIPEMARAKREYECTGKAARVFKDFRYRTLRSWSRSRRVIGKAEHLERGPNPRFVVTSYSGDAYDARTVYEQEYCARGEMENRIKEQQGHLFADRTSCREMHANQIRLWFSSVAYVLMQALREFGLAGTKMAKAQCGTIRTKLLKIGALVKVSVRRIAVSFTDGYPYEPIFATAYANLSRGHVGNAIVGMRACSTPMRC